MIPALLEQAGQVPWKNKGYIWSLDRSWKGEEEAFPSLLSCNASPALLLSVLLVGMMCGHWSENLQDGHALEESVKSSACLQFILDIIMYYRYFSACLQFILDMIMCYRYFWS